MRQEPKKWLQVRWEPTPHFLPLWWCWWCGGGGGEGGSRWHFISYVRISNPLMLIFNMQSLKANYPCLLNIWQIVSLIFHFQFLTAFENKSHKITNRKFALGRFLYVTRPLMALQNDSQVETSQKLQKFFTRILSIRLQCFLSSPVSLVSLVLFQ